MDPSHDDSKERDDILMLDLMNAMARELFHVPLSVPEQSTSVDSGDTSANGRPNAGNTSNTNAFAETAGRRDLYQNQSDVARTQICHRCRSTNFEQIFALDPRQIPWEGIPVFDLDSSTGKDQCDVCEFLSTCRFASNSQVFKDAVTCHIRAHSVANFLQDPFGTEPTPAKLSIRGGVCLTVWPGPSSALQSPSSGSDIAKFIDLRYSCHQAGCILPTQSSDTEIIRGRRLAKSVDLNLAKKWIFYCKSHHSTCQRSGEAVEGMKLIDCESSQIIPADAGNAQYAALSYVWGPSSGKPPFKGAEPPHDIPRVIEDAISVAKALGLRYLWVDKYCIDQSNASEKHSQIKQMHLIYQNAEVTLIAAAGQDERDGLAGISREKKKQPAVSVGRLELVSTLCVPHKSIFSSVWATRGWTYQESIISRRRLVFTDDQVYFECNKMYCNESVAAPLRALQEYDRARNRPVMHSFIFQLRKWDTPLQQFYEYVMEYTKRNLSFDSDAMNAFYGIAQYLKRTTGLCNIWGIPYFAKSFQADFARSLCWQNAHPGSDIRRTEFPSWSWLGWRRGIEFRLWFDKTWIPDLRVQIKSQVSDPGSEDEEGRTIVVIGHMVNPDRFSVSPNGELDIGVEGRIDWKFAYDSLDRTDLLAHMRDGRAQCLLIGIEAETVSTLRTAWFMAIIREGESASRIGLAQVLGHDLERKVEELKSKGALLQTANLALV